MNTATRNRYSGIDSFIICFYCNETFRTLPSLLKHICSTEQISLDLEPLDAFSEIISCDLDQEDSVVSTESSSEKPSDTPTLEITDAESNASIVDENSFSETECKKALQEPTLNATRQEITELAADASGKRLPEPNSDVVIQGTEPATEGSKKLLPVSDTGQKTSEVESITDEECDSTSPDLVSKVLLYYEKQTKPGTPDSFCKSPSTEIEFQTSCSPLLIAQESGSPRHNTQIECSETDECNISPTSERKFDTYGDNITQNESDASKQNTRALDTQASVIFSKTSSIIESDTTELNVRTLKSPTSNICSTASPRMESDSSNMFSRSSSVEMDLDTLGCGDDQAYSDDSEASNTILSKKESDLILHSHVQAESHASKNTVKSFPEKDLNITGYDSKIVKPCFVKVQDIFQSLLDSKVSPQKIFSRKKKYHVCDVCNKFFRLRTDLNIHYLVHTTIKPFVCNICNKSFMKQYNLLAHHLAHAIKRPHACSTCKKTFLKKSLLLRHKQIHTKEKPYACEKCNKSYTVKSSLSEHYLTHSDLRPFICEICNATFANKRYLRKHYDSHSNKNNVCHLCSKTFSRKHHLEEHMNTHSNEKPHKCKICSKTFHLLLTLNHHYAVTHRNERALIFPRNVETPADIKIGKNPVIQKIEVTPEVHRCEKTPLVEKPSIVHISKDTISYSTRRKLFIPRKCLQQH